MSCKKGANWTEGETRTFLELATEKSILNIMDGKKYRHVEIFRMLVPEMQKRGYEKTAEQMKLKLKNLKMAYFKCKRNNNVSGAAPSTCPFYNELEVLYGSRPISTLASNSSLEQVGIDTEMAEDNDDDVNMVAEETNEMEDEENIAPLAKKQKRTSEMEDEENIDPLAKKQKRTKSGRKSYEVILQSHTDKWMEKQTDLLNNIANKQMEFQKEIFHNEMIEQRKWEQEELAKERDFQKQQTTMILDAFTKSIQSLKSEIPVRSTQSTLKPLKLIPLNLTESPVSSTFATVQSTRNEKEESSSKINKFYFEMQ